MPKKRDGGGGIKTAQDTCCWYAYPTGHSLRDVLSRLRLSYPGFERIKYTTLNADLSLTAGHNRLLANADTVVTAI